MGIHRPARHTRRAATLQALLTTVLMALGGASQAQQTLTVAAFPAVDEIVRSAIPQWKRSHPNVDIKVVSRQFSDHHTAMTTAAACTSPRSVCSR